MSDVKNTSESIGGTAYSEFAERYAAIAPTKAHNALYERPATMSLLGEVCGLQVLDAGCGPGICSEYLARGGATVRHSM
jgi:2-polyprenyl-6-hydroxyphenyl methylase/3-demethylubiquinone-9 3-methyltransferase